MMTAGFGLKAILGHGYSPKPGDVCGSAPGMASGWRMTKSPLQLPHCSRKVVIYCGSVSAVNRCPPALNQPPIVAGSLGCAPGSSRLLPTQQLPRVETGPSPFLPLVRAPARPRILSLWMHGIGMAFLPSQGRLAGQSLRALGFWRCWGWSNSKCGRISTQWCCCSVKNWSKLFQALPWLSFVGRTG